MTTEELKRLRELCEKATGREWQRYGHIGSGSLARVRAIVGKCERTHREMFQDVPSDGNDAAFIAASRTALPALLDEVERLQAELAKVKVENRKLHTDAMFSQTAGEREACAKVAESYPMFGAVVAAAIRARGESEVSRG